MSVTHVYKNGISQAELNRIAIWPLTPKSVRAAVLLMAGLPRERAADGLETFNATERARIYECAATLARDAGVVAQCAHAGVAVVH